MRNEHQRPTPGPEMAIGAVTRKRSTHSKTKVKTGCATCRIRKVKCDEDKPFCQKCVTTGRTCDGYESTFRFCTSQPVSNTHTGSTALEVGLQPSASTHISPQEINLLEHYFSTKTVFNVKLGCDEEAKQILHASLADPPIRYAVSSLRALRENLEMFGGGPASVAQQISSFNYGLQQYGMALGGLASNLSSLGCGELKSALLCCQVFISIEQVQGNYAAMAQHIVRGLRIMHECRTRPYISAANTLVPAHYDQVPLLDVFVIKLFAAPCKFADPPARIGPRATGLSACLFSLRQRPVEPGHLRAIAPDMRTELTRIATSTLEFLGKVSSVETIGNALRLLSEKAALLGSLASWLTDLELVQMAVEPPGAESISMSFTRLFYLALKIIILGALDSSPSLDGELRTENDRLQGVATNLGERLKAFRKCDGSSSSQVGG